MEKISHPKTEEEASLLLGRTTQALGSLTAFGAGVETIRALESGSKVDIAAAVALGLASLRFNRQSLKNRFGMFFEQARQLRNKDEEIRELKNPDPAQELFDNTINSLDSSAM
ncbi:hypothetical protein HZB74_01820 [Candidatus Saccharibacteria bacterium]|nr:hypothetical protein [Candidatus Saccharibacteria bacterium]